MMDENEKSIKLEDNKELALKALEKDPYYFKYVSKRLQDDEEVVSKLEKDIKGFKSYIKRYKNESK